MMPGKRIIFKNNAFKIFIISDILISQLIFKGSAFTCQLDTDLTVASGDSAAEMLMTHSDWNSWGLPV